jgi:hypothetical protein
MGLRLFLIALAAFLTSCTLFTPPPDTPTPTPPLLPEGVEVVETFGSPSPAVHAFLFWNDGTRLRDLGLAKQMGVGYLKTDFPWRDIEPHVPGEYDWYKPDKLVEDAEAAGIELVVRLDRQPFWAQANGGNPPLPNVPPGDIELFEEFCEIIAARYKGRIAAYQVWNEPNLSREWGDHAATPEVERSPDAVEYVELLKACYTGIKRADAKAVVISAGLAPTGTDLPHAIPDERFLEEMYAAGAAEWFDVLGVNAPGYKAPPEASPDEIAADPDIGGLRWMGFRHVEDMRRIMVKHGDAHKQIAILEMGWFTQPDSDAYDWYPHYAWFAVDEETQADYLVRAYRYARDHWQPWVGLMTTIYFANPIWTTANEEYWWSLTYPDYPETRTRPAFDALLGEFQTPGYNVPDTLN